MSSSNQSSTCPDDRTFTADEQSIDLLESQPPVAASSVGVENHDEYDREYMDRVLENIDQMLMEEGGMDEQQTRMLQESFDFQAKERSFFELLHVAGPSSHDNIDQVVWNFQNGVDDSNTLLQRGRKNPPHADLEDEESRSRRVAAVYAESDSVPIENFDEALLFSEFDLEKKFSACSLHRPAVNKTKRGRRLGTRNQNEVTDFRSLLICCSQSIAADDRQSADEFLRQVREHSSPLGDGEQRLAHYLADALEARLAGTGTQIQKSPLVKRNDASGYLRAYYAYVSSSPFVRVSTFVSNKTICIRSAKENSVHVIDFGILYGFQWPSFIQRLAEREGGPPSLKITGIDFPQPGFRPAEIVEETGRRLARYAEKFNVPFEYHSITQSWESIKIEDLKIEKGEFVAVNCLYRADNLLDEAAGVGKESPRKMVLDLIRKIKPDCFVHGVVNAKNGLPFFASRFREVLFHYSALYDMLETTIRRDNHERAMLESDIFGREALNAIACENRERLGRTETYKQWRTHHLSAGFVQFPFKRKLMGSATKMVRIHYHRDFFISEDKDWLLMGWKGRILYAVSCWQPV